MSEHYLMGIDIGSSESKGVLCDLSGNVLALETRSHDIKMPKPGWFEQDPMEVWWGDFVKISKALIKKASVEKASVKGVAVSALGQDLLPVDRSGNPTRKYAILYGIDTRAAAQIEEMNRHLGEEQILLRSKNALSTQAVGPKISWLKENDPKAFEAADYYMTASSFLVLKLTNRAVIDHHQASFWVPLYDFDHRRWNRDFCEAYFDSRKLPELIEVTEVAGYISEEAAAKTGLMAGTPVTAGTSDAFAESISVGAVENSKMMAMYGSTTCLFMPVEKIEADSGVWSYASYEPGKYGVAMCTAASGSVTKWFKDCFAKELTQDAYGTLVSQAEEVEAGARGLIVLPYFSGERSPVYDTKAKGIIFGLTLNHTREDVYKAVLEGIAYSIRHNLERLNELGMYPETIVAVGGGIKNKIWLQAVSDICNITQLIPEIGIGASYGDAYLAGVGAGFFDDVEGISRWVRYKNVITPNKINIPVYEEGYLKYRGLYYQTRSYL